MFETENIVRLSRELDVDILAKVIFSFSPDIVMSPLALPKEILHPWVDETISKLASGSSPLKDILVQLKTRPTFQEQWPNDYTKAIARGKARVLKLESIRTQPITMREILSARPQVLEWWDSIEEI
jgi:hypothetical protein